MVLTQPNRFRALGGGGLRVAPTLFGRAIDFHAPPRTVEQIPGGYKVKDANGHALAYVYARETRADADTAKV